MKKFPGPIALGILQDNKRYYATNTQGSRVCVRDRDGAIVWDHDGFRFIDLHCDASVNILGGHNPAITLAIEEQVKSGNIFSEHHNAPNLSAVELAMDLAQKSPVPRPAKVYFSNSGAEANEAAMKLCKAYRFVRNEHDKKKTIYFRNAFHGRTLGILPGTNSKPEVQRDPFVDHCDQENSIYLPYPAHGVTRQLYYDIFRKDFGFDLSAVSCLIIELPCQGEGGIIPANEASVRYLYRIAKENEIIFIVDGIQCGMGRTGTLFGCDIWEWLKPDILVLGKQLCGGIPAGVTIFRADLDFAKPGMHSSTFGGGPLASRVGLAVLAEIEKLISNGTAKKLETVLSERLWRIQEKFPRIITETRGVGAMWAHEIVSSELRDSIQEKGEALVETEEYGIRLLAAGRKAIRFMPPLTIDLSLLNYALDLYEKVLSSI